MTIQNINVGDFANDGTGDDLRDAFIKINQNFQTVEVDLLPTGRNLGSSGAEVFAATDERELQFRRLVAGTNVSLTQLDNVIQINSSAASFVISTDQGSLIVNSNTTVNFLGSDNVNISGSENDKSVTVDLSDRINRLGNFDLGDIDVNIETIVDYIINSTVIDLGSITSAGTVEIDFGTL